MLLYFREFIADCSVGTYYSQIFDGKPPSVAAFCNIEYLVLHNCFEILKHKIWCNNNEKKVK